MAAASSRTEHPLGEGGQLDSEEGVRVLDGLGHGARAGGRRAGLGTVSQSTPPTTLMKMASAPLVVAAAVRVERGADLLEERLGAGHREQRELEQDERLDDLGVVEGQLGRDRPTAGVAGDVSAPHTEMIEECGSVGGVIHDAHRPHGAGAADPTTLVVPDQLVAAGQLRFGDERQEPVGQDGTDQQHGFARPDHLVLELDAIDLCSLHESSSDWPCWGLVVPNQEA